MYRIHSEEYSQMARRTSTNNKTTLIFSICSWDLFNFQICSDYSDYIILKNYLFICLLDTAYFWRESQRIVILSPYNAISKHDSTNKVLSLGCMMGLLSVFHHTPKWLLFALATLSFARHSFICACSLHSWRIYYGLGIKLSTDHDSGLTKPTVQQGTQLLR